MNQEDKTKKQLLDEIDVLNYRVKELEESESQCRKVKEALKEKDAYLETILSTIQTGIILIDKNDQRIVNVNDMAAQLIGASKEEIEGQLCHKFICPAEQGQCPIVDLNQTVDQSERVLLDVNGREIPIIKSVVPINLNGHEYLLESFIDITERKKIEETLKKREEKYRDIVGKFLKVSNEILIEMNKR